MYYIITVKLPTNEIRQYNLSKLVAKGLTQEFYRQRNSTYLYMMENAYINVPVTNWHNGFAIIMVGKIINIAPIPRPDYQLLFSKNQYYLANDVLNITHNINYMQHDYTASNKYLIKVSIYDWAIKALCNKLT